MFWVLLMFLAGMALILAEFLVPGAICGIAGVCLLFASGGMAIYAYPEYAFWVVIAEFAGAIASVMLGFYLFPRIGLGKRMILHADQTVENGWVSNETDTSLRGKLGVVFSALRPSGMIEIGSQRLGAVSTGDFIGKGETVRIIEVHGNRVVVEKADA